MKKAWLAAGIGILAALVVFGVVAPPALAFERLCKPYEFCVWDTADMPIPYTVDLASLAAYPIQPFQPTYEPFDVVEIIKQAFQAWADVREAYVRFQYAGPNVAFDLRNPRPLIRVYFTPDNAAERHLAVKNAKGAFVYVEIRIGTLGGSITVSKYKFYKTMLHEIGHALGLGHPREYPRVGGPVMGYGWFPESGPWAQFDRDDIEGIHYLYPASRGSSQQIRVSGPPEVEIWPASGNVTYQGQDFAVAVTASDGREVITNIQVLLNGQDVTPAVGWLFQVFGRTNPHGYVLSVPQRVLDYTGALHRVGLECWLQPMTCSFFPVRSVSPFTITVISRDRSGQEARLERTYTIVP